MGLEIEKKRCFNCQNEYDVQDAYCPHCGQKNDSNNLNLKAVTHEFIENYISFDSRLGRSIRPFLFRPGFLTQEFNAGKRIFYANPFRLYILISILFFFVFNQFIQEFDNVNFTLNGKVITESDSLDSENAVYFMEIDSLINHQLNRGLSDLILGDLKEQQDKGFEVAFDSLTDYRKGRVLALIPDSLQAKLKLPEDEEYTSFQPNIGFNFEKGFDFGLEEFDMDLISRYRYDKKVKDVDVLKQMKLGNLSDFNTSFLLQLIRVLRGDSTSISKYIISNFAFAMFFMIPMFALLLMLLNYRKSIVFVEHLIHSLHLHSFAFLLISIALILILTIWNILFAFFCNLIVSILLLVYFFRSCRRIYQRKKLSTFIRLILVSILYYFVFLFTLFVEVFISILLY